MLKVYTYVANSWSLTFKIK